MRASVAILRLAKMETAVANRGPMSDDPVFHVLEAQSDAARRGALAIWTVYNRPDDYPDGYIARMSEVARGGEPIATSLTLTGRLYGIRQVLAKAGLVVLPRKPDDEPQIVESWL
jgi:hypothetical protein